MSVGGTVGCDRHPEDEGTWEYGQRQGTHWPHHIACMLGMCYFLRVVSSFTVYVDGAVHVVRLFSTIFLFAAVTRCSV